MAKSKLWASILYEESKNEYWLEMLKETNLPMAISPIHDKDIYTEYDRIKWLKENDNKEPKWKVGEYKKPHYHILIEYGNTTTEKNIKEMLEPIGCVGLIPVKSKKGYYEYLTHENEEDKAKYDRNKIIEINGFELTKEEFTIEQIEEMKRTTITLINELNICEYSEIYDYCLKENLLDLCKIISRNTMFFYTYIKSKQYVNRIKKSLKKENKEL